MFDFQGQREFDRKVLLNDQTGEVVWEIVW